MMDKYLGNDREIQGGDIARELDPLSTPQSV